MEEATNASVNMSKMGGAYRSSSAAHTREASPDRKAGSPTMQMSQTFSRLPAGRVPPLEKVLGKIKES